MRRARHVQLISEGLLYVTVARLGLWVLRPRQAWALLQVITRVLPYASAWPPVEIARVVGAVSRRVPHATCLTQALAVRAMLVARKRRPLLRIGVARDPGGVFVAHAWLELDGAILIGGAQSPERYTALPLVEL